MDTHTFNRIRQAWSDFVKDADPDKYNLDLSTRFPFLRFYENSGIAFAILNNSNFRIIHQSRNFFEVVGIDKKEFELHNTNAFIHAVKKDQLNFFDILVENFKEYWDLTPYENRNGVVRTTFGLIMNHSTKGFISLHIKTNVLDLNEYFLPSYIFVVYQDVTHLIKDDFYWFRFHNPELPDHLFAYHDGLKETMKYDILSTREKEILTLIAEGKSPEEIGNKLFISRITVNNHRQNMLNKIGVKDTTALVQAAKMCFLIN
ncbi:MAG TPA: helix-turn-helix transcriptional regulator [Allocoleopsis sp.]